MTQYQISDVAQRVYTRAAYTEKGQPIVVTNNDNFYTLYADDNQSVTPQSDQIGPHNSLAFDGSRDVWLSSLDPAVKISAQVIRGSTQQTASPLDSSISLYQQLTGGSPQFGPVTLGPGQSTTLTPVSPSPAGLASSGYPAYEIAIGLTAGISSTSPFAVVYITWYDYDQATQSQVPVDTLRVAVPMGASGNPNGPAISTGRGPMRGAYMQIEIINQDSVNATLAYLQVTGTFRDIQKDNWWWDCGTSPAIPGYTLGYNVANTLTVGMKNALSLAAGAQKSEIYSLAPGRVILYLSVGGLSTNQCEITITPLPSSLWGNHEIFKVFLGASPTYLTEIALPRAPILMTYANNSTSQATVDMSMVAVQ
jgi:hypothetical protein